MKKSCATVAALLLTAAPLARAEDPPSEKKGSQTGEITMGVTQSDVDTLSSKFEEYREVPNGLVLPRFRMLGEAAGLHYDFRAENTRQADQRYVLRVGNERFRLDGDYNQIPHRFGNAGRTLLQQT